MPFSRLWYSWKFNGPALKYELAVSIKGGDLVSIVGPYPGSFHDIDLFREEMINKLLPGEMCEADKGYRGESSKIRVANVYQTLHEKKQKDRARNRHETLNKRLKQFGILGKKYRHKLEDHRLYFDCCAVLTQLSIENGEPLFAVNWNY